MADSEASRDDRQLAPSERRLQKARAEGNVARSRDVGHALVLGAALLRVAVPLAAPALAYHAVLASAALWSAGFGVYAWRYFPVLTRPRLDGKPG